ncbi:MAG: cystathionine gamma-synthase family protein [Candidatus Kapaibacterium sp.]|nr:cystathionine gamma-synthase family protein [Ignavibacteriota bacterium]MCB9220329.1 cystathionine gamma-synthase family protein [Ignavibacteria bacterium]
MQRNMKPESLMMSYGYKPELSEGSLKCPIFQTSTFVFKNAEEGKAFFEVAYGLREKGQDEELGLIYSRINNPDLEILENRLCLWDKADECAVFESGMSAISTVFMEFLNPGDVLVYSSPLYGGTDHFIHHFLPKYGINTVGFKPNATKEEIKSKIDEKGYSDKVAMFYIETPANPTNAIVDLQMINELKSHYSSEEKKILTVVDNTYMGPLWQHPLRFGADLIVYSATKYIGGHSDVIAGAVLGYKEPMKRVKTLRTFLGNMAGPWTGWLLMRSLETLKVRMEQQQQNAIEIAKFLNVHPKVTKVHYLGMIDEDSASYELYKRQHDGPGAMVAFDIDGGEKEAFKFLNSLKLMTLAVSLGGTESLAEHPSTMTHAGVEPEYLKSIGVTESLVRLSIGVENIDDLIWDISQALEKV